MSALKGRQWLETQPSTPGRHGYNNMAFTDSFFLKTHKIFVSYN